MKREKRIVFAGTHRQYLNFCAQYELNPNTEALYVSSVDVLKGLHFDRELVWYVGTWYERKDRDEIEEEIRIAELRNMY